MPRTVECFQCHIQVADLQSHRGQCNRSRASGSTRTVECYDCHKQVEDLRAHRRVCSNSRFAHSVVNSQSQPIEPITITTTISTATAIVAPIAVERDFFFLLDVSGSMAGARLTQAKTALSTLFEQLQGEDRFSLLTFDTKAFFKCKPRPVGQLRRQQELNPLLERIFAQGGTALYDAIILAIGQVYSCTVPTTLHVLTDGRITPPKPAWPRSTNCWRLDPTFG